MAILRIPTLIDPHVHLPTLNRAMGQKIARIAQQIGYAGLQIMPDLNQPITDQSTLGKYRQMLSHSAIPLYLTVAATNDNLDQIKRLRTVRAVKVWLGTGPLELVIEKEEQLKQILLSTDKIVMVHAEDELVVMRNFETNNYSLNMLNHERIYSRQSAIRATVKAIAAAKETGRRIYICHISTGEEVELIRQAKQQGIRVFAEVAPHHLFLTNRDLKRLGKLAKVNPPLRSQEDQTALWRAINDGTIDTIGSDNYPWNWIDKHGSYNDVPTGLPNLELTLPLLLSAVSEKKLSLKQAIALTSVNPARIFKIPRPTGSIFVDMDNPHPIRTRLANWHPYESKPLVGWPLKQRI